MAKKIYNVTFANGTIEEYTSKKAVKALEGIAKVTVGDEDVTNEFIATEVVENIEAVEEPEEPEGPKDTILFTASKGTGKRLNWYRITTNPLDEVVKVKGCAALIPMPVAEALGADKFVSWMPQAAFEACVAEGKVVRGMASTVSDVFNRYIKVNEIKGADRVETALAVFNEVLEAIANGNNAGGWARPEPEVPEGEPEVEATEPEAVA